MFDPTPGRRAGPLRHTPVLAAALSVTAVLLLCWPFVRDPPLDLRDAYLHLFGAWAALIAVAWWLSRGVPHGGARQERP